MEQSSFITIKRQRIVDSREPESIRLKLIETGWEQSMLRLGDYFLHSHSMQKIGVTRKTTSDLLASLGENFAKQLEEMLDYYDINILLIEGNFNIDPANDRIIGAYNLANVTMQQIRNWRHRWQAKGFILEPTLNENQTVKRLNELYSLYMKPYSTSAKSRGYADDRILSLPSGTRGVVGQKVLREFGSLQAIANAEIEDLLSIKGVGDRKANAIYNHFRKVTKSQEVNNGSRRVSTDTRDKQERELLL